VPNASYYKVYRDDSFIHETSSTSYTEYFVPSGTHYYRVRAVSSSGDEGELSSSRSVAVGGGGPQFPPSEYTPLTEGSWTQGYIGAGDVKWYSFTASPGNAYEVSWDDSYRGSGSYTADIEVSAYSSSQTPLFSPQETVDTAYAAPQQISGYSGTVYLKVQGFNSSETGSYAIKYSQAGAGALPAPTGLYAYSSGSSVYLEWDSVSGASSYYVYRNGTYRGSTVSLSFTEYSVSPGTYSYQVSAVSSNGVEGPRAICFVTVGGGEGDWQDITLALPYLGIDLPLSADALIQAITEDEDTGGITIDLALLIAVGGGLRVNGDELSSSQGSRIIYPGDTVEMLAPPLDDPSPVS
jgi:hypothetical protein